MKKKWVIQILLLITTAQALMFAQATQQPVVLDIAMVEALVISNNVEYKIAQMNFAQAKREKNSMWNEFLPTVNASVATNSSADTAGYDPWTATMRLDAVLDLSGWVWMSMIKTQRDYETGAITYELAQQKLITGARTAFYNLLLSEEKLMLARETTEVARGNMQQKQRNFNSGMAQQLDLLNAQVTFENESNRYEESRTKHEELIMSFKHLLGLPLTQPIELKGSIDVDTVPFNAQRLIAAFKGRDLAVLEALAQQDAQAWQTWERHAQQFLRPFAKASYAYFGPTTTSNEHLNNNLTLTLGVNMSLDAMLPYSKSGLSLWAQRDALKEKTMMTEDQLVQNEIAIINQANKLNDISSRMTSLNNAVRVSQTALDLTITGFRQGVRTQLEVDTAINNRNVAQINLSEARFNYFNALQQLSIITNQSIYSLLRFARLTNTQ